MWMAGQKHLYKCITCPGPTWPKKNHSQSSELPPLPPSRVAPSLLQVREATVWPSPLQMSPRPIGRSATERSPSLKITCRFSGKTWNDPKETILHGVFQGKKWNDPKKKVPYGSWKGKPGFVATTPGSVIPYLSHQQDKDIYEPCVETRMWSLKREATC